MTEGEIDVRHRASAITMGSRPLEGNAIGGIDPIDDGIRTTFATVPGEGR